MEIQSEGVALDYSLGAWAIVVGTLICGGGWPEVNGRVYRDLPAQLTQDAGAIEATYDLGGDLGFFKVSAQTTPAGIQLRYSMPGVKAPQSITRFGLHFDKVEGMKRFYRSGYHSWDGSYFVQPDTLSAFAGPEMSIERSYAVTELIPTGDGPALVAGFDRHHRYQQTFVFGARKAPIDLSIATWWDRKDSPSGELASENLLLLSSHDYEEGMRRWALLAAEASLLSPRRKSPPLVGWGTWYNLYNFINEPLVLESASDVSSVAERESLPMHTFIVDAGFTPELGDWLKTNGDFPGGLKPVTDAIRASGLSPALWIAPLLVGNRSELYRQHPDWVLRDATKTGPKTWGVFYGEQRLGKMRSEEYYVLDLSHPEVMDYLRTVFRTWKQDWGADSFKIDFTYLAAEWGPDEVLFQRPGSTRVELWRAFAEMIRQEIGDEAIWVASGQPLWASIGLADTIRIAGDAGVVWSGNGPSALPLLQSLPYRNFTNHILWQIDPDAVLLRTRYHYLTEEELKGLAVLAGMSGGALITSDNLNELPADRIALWKMLLSSQPVSARYPRFGRDEVVYVPYQVAPDQPPVPIAFTDPVIVQTRLLANGDSVVHLLNTSESSQTRSYSLTELGAWPAGSSRRFLLNWWTSESSENTGAPINFTLPGRTGMLLYVSSENQGTPPATLGGN